MRILVAEDEISINKALKVMLEKSKYTVDSVYDGVAALSYIENTTYDVIVLDIMMPLKDGIEVLTTIRSKGIHTPVLFLTAKSEVQDRVLGLDAGADDYLRKPFVASEFLARVRALSRRSQTYTSSSISIGNTTLDLNQYVLKTSYDEVKLNNKEFQLLELFLRNPKRVFSSELLMEKVWDIDSSADIDVVWTYIGFLTNSVNYNVTDEELKEYNEASDDDKDKDSVTRYVRLNDSKIIYTISSSTYNTLTSNSYDDLRHQEVFPGDMDSVTSMEISLEGTNYTFTKEDDTWKYNDTEIDIDTLKSDLTSLDVDSFTTDTSSSTKEVSITLNLDNENYPTYKMDFYRYDGNSCIVYVDDKSYAYVSRSDVVDIIEAIHQIVLN